MVMARGYEITGSRGGIKKMGDVLAQLMKDEQ